MVVYSPKYFRDGGLTYSDFVWIKRRNYKTGEIESFNLSTLEVQNGEEKANNSTKLREFVEVCFSFLIFLFTLFIYF